MLTPGEIRAAISDTVEELDGDRLSNGFKSLMDYIDLDLLVGWFVDEVCAGESVFDIIDDPIKADAIDAWYNLHC